MLPNEKGTTKDLVLYRIETAKTDLQSAEVLFEIPEYRGANNRAYKDAIANFNKDYIKTEIFPRSLGRRIAEAEEIRHASDYDDFYIATKAETGEQIETAREVIKVIEKYCLETMLK